MGSEARDHDRYRGEVSPRRKRKHSIDDGERREEHDRHGHRSRRSKHHHDSRDHRSDRHTSKAQPRPSPAAPAPARLPYDARPLARSDLASYRPLFAMYLDVQKQIWLPDLDEREVKGRWKSFLKKWNTGELAGGWYDPEMLVKARRLQEEGEIVVDSRDGNDDTPGKDSSRHKAPRINAAHTKEHRHGSADLAERKREGKQETHSDNEEDDEEWGPALAPSASASASPGPRQGPGIPNLQDLQARREAIEEDRQERLDDIRTARKADRREQRERLEELVPRADPGTRERKLEKKREVNDKMRSFRDKSPGMEEAQEGELLGEDADSGLGAYKRMLETAQRKKTEREVRREEFERARNEERDERIKEYRAREESTVEKLKELARQRFG